MGTNADTEKLKELYQSLDRLKASGEDVIAEIRREINNIELQYLKDNLFPEIMKIIGERISRMMIGIIIWRFPLFIMKKVIGRSVTGYRRNIT